MRIIAFYLPQFHPIPENDAWWGKGFTEWTNVAKARPLFRGHHQPQVPADLGFYDLRLEEIRIAQADLAREYGIGGFCYYHYWFNGKMLLERPFNEVLASGRPDFPFCLCWANENWSRRWDGMEQDVLAQQNYDEYDPIQHLEWLARAFRDARYIKVSGKPLFLVYWADHVPRVADVLATWRREARRILQTDLYVCAVRSHKFGLTDAETVSAGFDALVNFHPHPKHFIRPDQARITRFINTRINALCEGCGLDASRWFPIYSQHDYAKYVANVCSSSHGEVKQFPCVFPSWDNSARKKRDATIIQNVDAALFAQWVRHSLKAVERYPEEERIVFVNSWNEWAEGCHLEPDLRNGRRFLEAVRDALADSARVRP
ncbi:MAG TPA: glycoside hydrolase family 99-like domain-containing protein [Candidatus Methylomirabilis sp.]|nr:glycoside hydrolase family 99-like domain-containing protein [Candidatus Methylomirabilis sp.]